MSNTISLTILNCCRQFGIVREIALDIQCHSYQALAKKDLEDKQAWV
jgi:hypothetical protein